MCPGVGLTSPPPPVRPAEPSYAAARNLSALLDLDSEAATCTTVTVTSITISVPQRRDRAGCCRLECLQLQSCEGVTERGVMLALDHLASLRRLDYQQKYSLLEILVRWSAGAGARPRRLQLEDMKHVFPYEVSPLSPQLPALAALLPRLTSLTLVTLDAAAATFALFPQLRRLTLELEDCLGEGLLQLLTQLGPQLLEVNISCSSDPHTPLTLDQTAGPAGQQGQLFNAAVLAVGELCPAVSKLSVSGCGLVSTAAVDRLRIEEKLSNPRWLQRQAARWFSDLTSFILMSYDDTNPAMTIHSGLLKSVLSASSQLMLLHLEGYFGTFITDEYFLSVLKCNPLEELRVLNICISDEGSTTGRIPLSMRAVQGVLGSCTNIKEVRLADWSLTSEEISALDTRIKEENWDLTVGKTEKFS